MLRQTAYESMEKRDLERLYVKEQKKGVECIKLW